MKKIAIASLLCFALALTACVVEPAGRACAWVPGHFAPNGLWVRGHCE